MAKYQLTQTERNKMEEVLRGLAESAIATVTARRPAWEEEILEQARKRAVGLLKIEKPLLRLEALNSKIAEMENERDELEETIKAKLPRKIKKKKTYLGNGMHETEEDYDSCDTQMNVCEAINKLSAQSRNAAMAAHPTGKLVIVIRSRLQKQLAVLEKCSTRDDVNRLKVMDFDP